MNTSSLSAWLGAPFAQPRANQGPTRTESNSPNPSYRRSTQNHFFQLAVKIRIDDTAAGDTLMSRRPSSVRAVPLALYRTFSRVIVDSFPKIFLRITIESLATNQYHQKRGGQTIGRWYRRYFGSSQGDVRRLQAGMTKVQELHCFAMEGCRLRFCMEGC